MIDIGGEEGLLGMGKPLPAMYCSGENLRKIIMENPAFWCTRSKNVLSDSKTAFTKHDNLETTGYY